MVIIWKKCKVLTEFNENRHVFELIDCKQILNESGVPYSMDLIRCDNNERVYFGGLTYNYEMFWVIKKYTKPTSI